MQPSELRERVLEDHARLRRDLAELERLASCVREQPGRLEELRRNAEALLMQLQTHMRWEESHLVPALRDTDAWGRERAERLIDEHGEQREVIDLVVEQLWDGKRSAVLVGRDVVRLIGLLLEDMAAEEGWLDERVLGDEVIGFQVETG
jgi:hypothetical protein